MTQKTLSVTGRGIIILLPLFILSAVPLHLFAEDSTTPILLRYIHTEGEVLHADALVRERVYIDGYHSHDAEINESSLSRTVDVRADGSAVLESEFITDEWIVGNPGYREWMSSETVSLTRNQNGTMEVPESASRPVLREIPVFPEEPVRPGDSWMAPAEEVHVFRIGGRLWGPYRGDLLASYEYEGDEWHENIRLARIRISYDLYLPIRQSGEPVRLVSGSSSQILYWDIEAGQPLRKEETFEFFVMMSSGQTQEIVGAQTVKYRRNLPLDRNEVISGIEGRLTGNVKVDPVREGIRLTLDESRNILFDPESSVVSRDQRAGLEVLSHILDDFGDRDILISGHTADYGTVEGQKSLSLDRAAAVADILFPDGRQGSGKLYLRGMGTEEPVGSDGQNRRVEILILD